MIPKIVHFVWVGPNRLPEDALRRIEGWKALLPDYEFRRWDETNIDFTPLFLRQAYGVGAYNRVANYARMAALERFGGVYMDHDIELVKSFDPLLGDGFFAGFQTMDADAADIVNCAVMGGAPGHPFARKVLAALDRINGRSELGSGTGPGMLSKVLRQSGSPTPQHEPLRFDGVTLYPPRYFYPYEWDQPFDPACVTADTVAIHHWAATWQKKATLGERTYRKALRLLTAVSPSLGASIVRSRNLRLRSAGKP